MKLLKQRLEIISNEECKKLFPEISSIYLTTNESNRFYSAMKSGIRHYNSFSKSGKDVPNRFYSENFYITTFQEELEYNGISSPESLLLDEIENPTKYHPKRIIAKILCDSLCVNKFFLSKNKFQIREIIDKTSILPLNIILPYWWDSTSEGLEDNFTDKEWDKKRLELSMDERRSTRILGQLEFICTLTNTEDYIIEMLDPKNKLGFREDDIYNILPLSTARTLIVAGFEEDWEKFKKQCINNKQMNRLLENI